MITAKSAIERAIQTAPQWDRTKYIGASEIGKCSLALYYTKSEGSSFKGNGKTERGNALESAVIALMKRGGMYIRSHDDGRVNRQREITHPDFPVCVHPDGIIFQGLDRPHAKIEGRTVTDFKEVAVLEIKTVGTDRFRSLKEPDESWVTQTRFNAFMAKLPKGMLVAVDASDLENVKEWEYQAMSETEALPYLERAKQIMDRIEIGLEPDAEPSSESCRWCEWKDRCEKRWVPDEEAKAKEVEVDDLKPALQTLAKAKEMMAEAKEMESGAKAAILNAGKSHDAARMFSGGLMAIIEARKGRVSLDTKQMLADHPEIDRSQYEKRGSDTVAVKLKEI